VSRNRSSLQMSGPSHTTAGRLIGLIRHGRRSLRQLLRYSLTGLQARALRCSFASLISTPLAAILQRTSVPGHQMPRESGSALLEFAIAWPVALLLIVGSVQVAVWGSEAFAAKQAALAGARAGIAAGGSVGLARSAALASLRPVLVGVNAGAWCPSSAGPPPSVWVCVTWSVATVEVRVGGSVPALLPLLPGARGLPVGADVRLDRETFR
jgi:TadE-like protein